MSATPDIDSIRTDTEELEAAILGVLAAMDGTNEQEQMAAFRRFRQIFEVMADWPHQQKLISGRYLAERGQVEAGDLESVIDAVKELSHDSGPAS